MAMTTPGLLAGANAVSSIAGAAGDIISGSQQNYASKFNARQSELDAVISKNQADIEEHNFRTGIERLMGEQRAGYAKGGVTFSGSVLDVQADTAMQAERDALTIQYSGLIKANNFKTQAAIQRVSGRSAVTAGWLGATGSILTGMTNQAAITANQKLAEQLKGK